MRVENISTTKYSPNFGVKISTKTKPMQNYLGSLQKNSVTPEGQKRLTLFNKIIDAFEKHPSDAVIEIEKSKTGATVKSQYSSLEREFPQKSDDYAVESTIKELINPYNGNTFRILAGKDDPHTYEKWWNKNIFRIWNEADETLAK